MYNQFTAIDQQPLPMGKVHLNPMELPKIRRKKKRKLNSKNPYKIKKVRLLGEQAMAEKQVDGFLLLKMLHAEHPKEIVYANISYRRIVKIVSEHLMHFTNLVELECSQNYIRLEDLSELPAVERINISHNQLRTFNLEKGGFSCLQKLNVSFNFIEPHTLPQLTLLPSLIDLDLSFNELSRLPEDLSNFTSLKRLNLQGNNFCSDEKASTFWAALATIPLLEVLSIARNQIRGIHTQKLVAGNFSTLVELDFCFNVVENQHNLICARNFVSLRRLYITGNPFALSNQYKGLEMEVYARAGAEVIVEKMNPYYLKPIKAAKPPIKFSNLVKVKQDNFYKKKNALFGIDLPREEDMFSSSSSESYEPEVKEEQESEPEEPMFVTEQAHSSNRLKKSERKSKQSSIGQAEDAQPNQSVQSQVDASQSEHQNKSINSSLQGSVTSKSIEYHEFHKVAAQLLGQANEHKKSFDIHTSYKALKNAVDRVSDDI